MHVFPLLYHILQCSHDEHGMRNIAGNAAAGAKGCSSVDPSCDALHMPVHRGMGLPSLDVTYFTSLSCYILLLFWLRGVLLLVFLRCYKVHCWCRGVWTCHRWT